MKPKFSDRETQYRPQAGKTLRQALKHFITREFPRLGGPWVIDLFVDKLLQLVDRYHVTRDRLAPGQTLWPAIAIEERGGYHKPTYAMKQLPVVITLVNQEDVSALRQGVKWTELLKQALARAAKEAYAQGGVLTTSDLSLLFHHSHSRIAELIREYEAETEDLVPRRGNVHDMGRTVTHKRLICRKAYLEGKITPTIALETGHSPEAVDRYLLDFARVHFATIQRGMSVEEATFATQLPRSLVEEYVKLILEFGLHNRQVSERARVELERCKDRRDQSPEDQGSENQSPKQDPSHV